MASSVTLEPGRVAAPAAPELTARVALVQAQLGPIASRAALMDSWRRESLVQLSIASGDRGDEVRVLELAYARRWLELGGGEPAGEERVIAVPLDVDD